MRNLTHQEYETHAGRAFPFVRMKYAALRACSNGVGGRVVPSWRDLLPNEGGFAPKPWKGVHNQIARAVYGNSIL